jgi:hypothetical protein
LAKEGEDLGKFASSPHVSIENISKHLNFVNPNPLAMNFLSIISPCETSLDDRGIWFQALIPSLEFNVNLQRIPLPRLFQKVLFI